MSLDRFSLIALAALCLVACASAPETASKTRVTARPKPAATQANDGGSIFAAAYAPEGAGAYRPLFEDMRARRVGDSLVIALNEKTNASKQASSSASKTNDVEFGLPVLNHLPGKSLLGAELEASSSNKFDGQGQSAANNQFTGTIACTVVEVLPNGHLLVSGEKQIAINQGEEFIRFSGVVNPTTINGANTVSSTQVADARIEYKGSGYINQAQKMGWLSRFFLTVLPF